MSTFEQLVYWFSLSVSGIALFLFCIFMWLSTQNESTGNNATLIEAYAGGALLVVGIFLAVAGIWR